MENIVEKIKLPSNWMLVNPDSIWKHITCISKTGSVFTKEQLIANGLYTQNEDNITRNLSYIKYLGVIDEERGKGKDQKFKVVDKAEVKDILYELKANRVDSATEKFKSLIKQHELFSVIKKDFFGSEKLKTFIDLEHFLKEQTPGKTPQYYQKGGSFLMRLLQMTGLVSINGNDIELKDSIPEPSHSPSNNTQGGDTQPPKTDTAVNDKDVQQLDPKSAYSVTICTPNMNFKVNIEGAEDILIVESILKKVKKEIEGNGSL